MSLVTLTEVKNHLRIDQSAEDALLSSYIEAAEDWISCYLNEPSVPQTAAIKAACLLVVGDLYENREGAGEKEIKENPAVARLLHFYRKDLGI